MISGHYKYDICPIHDRFEACLSEVCEVIYLVKDDVVQAACIKRNVARFILYRLYQVSAVLTGGAGVIVETGIYRVNDLARYTAI
jgi:hypothetical protein